MATIVLNGFGPHVRFRTTETDAKVSVITDSEVKSVSLSEVTDLTFDSAA